MELGTKVRIKKTGDVGIIVEKYFWGFTCILLIEDDRECKWVKELNELEIIEEV